MKYRKFGPTGLEVSALGMGCMRLPLIGSDPLKIDEEKAGQMIHQAIDSGVNYIDTAYSYHGTGFSEGGKSEPFLGKALKNGYREKVYLATKLPCWLVESREDMDRFLERQLERLQTNTIDFYLLHSLNKGSWKKMQEFAYADFLNRAFEDGKIRYAGFSFHDELEYVAELFN